MTGRGFMKISCFVFITFLSMTKCASTPLAVFQRREPNNVQCFKNGDCLSDCCISNNGWIGTCVGRPQVGQICGLFTSNSASGSPLNWGLLNSFLQPSANNDALWPVANTNDYSSGILQNFKAQNNGYVSASGKNSNNNFDLSQLATLDFSGSNGYGRHRR